MTADRISVPPTRLVLIGMMGSGKSTVGRKVASSVDWPMLDNDTLLAELTGSEAQALSLRGPAVLHDAEAEVVRQVLERPPPFVAGAAAAVVEYPDVVDRLRRHAFTVYLRATVRTLARRVGTGADRPWLNSDPVTELTRLYEGREALYQRASSAVVNVDQLPPQGIADEILALAAKRGT